VFSHDQIPVLSRNEILDTVFSFVGVGEYYYVAGVCRNWRGRYMQLCAQTVKSKNKRFNTSLASIVATAARLQLALDNGFTIEQLQEGEERLAVAFAEQSLEPIKVITLARLYGMQWNESLPQQAAIYQNFELLKWLRKCGCPWDLGEIIDNACDSDDLEHMKQVRAVTGPWPAAQLTNMMWSAGWYDQLEFVQWWHEQGAAWPKSFAVVRTAPSADCWSFRCVQWAVANGSTWRAWRCQNLAAELYYCMCEGTAHSDDTCYPNCNKKKAAELFQWAHENGCPCTCNEVAAAAV
jgi:hypothetical protein